MELFFVYNHWISLRVFQSLDEDKVARFASERPHAIYFVADPEEVWGT